MKKLRVFFPESVSENWLGGLNYFTNLFIALKSVQSVNIEPYIFAPNEERCKTILQYAKPLAVKKTPFYYFYKKIYLPLSKKPFDIRTYALKKASFIDAVSHTDLVCNKPSLLWIADFQHVHLPEMFTKEQLQERDVRNLQAVQNASLVILSSKDAKKDFIKSYPTFAHKARVLHFVAIPDDDIYQKTDSIAMQTVQKYNLPAKYFYCPNQFWKHKNHLVLFKAINILKKQGLDVHLVCSGNTVDGRNPDYYPTLQKYIQDNDLQNNIHILGIIERLELFYLMRYCVSLVNPSLFEGWSSTIEEAKSIGKNCVLSNLSVHQEQNPADSQFFERTNEEDLARVLADEWQKRDSAPNKALELSAKENLQKRIRQFGEEYCAILQEALGANA